MGKAVQLHEETAIVGNIVTPPEMLNQALTSGASIEIMERLMDMSAKWEAMQARKAFDNAIAKLRGNLPEIVKTRDGHNYKYEALADIVRAISPPMAELGLSFRWRTAAKDGLIIVTCIVAHSEGHSEETSLPAHPDNSGSKNAIQALGSTVTYLQRYTLKAAVGIAAAHDDDAQSVGKTSKPENVSKAGSRDGYKAAVAKLREATTISELEGMWNSLDWSSIPEDWRGSLQGEQRACVDEINKQKPVVTKDANETLDRQFPGDLEHQDTAQH